MSDDLKTMQDRIGEEIFLGDWEQVTQSRIDEFARSTGDLQWIHTDPQKAKSSLFGATIAHGVLALGVLGRAYEEFLPALLPGYDLNVNYGFNKVRFTHPIVCDSRIRARFTLAAADPVDSGIQFTFSATVEIEGITKPACFAECIIRRLRQN